MIYEFHLGFLLSPFSALFFLPNSRKLLFFSFKVLFFKDGEDGDHDRCEMVRNGKFAWGPPHWTGRYVITPKYHTVSFQLKGRRTDIDTVRIEIGGHSEVVENIPMSGITMSYVLLSRIEFFTITFLNDHGLNDVLFDDLRVNAAHFIFFNFPRPNRFFFAQNDLQKKRQ